MFLLSMALFTIMKIALIFVFYCVSQRTAFAISNRKGNSHSLGDVNSKMYEICKEKWCEQYSPAEVEKMFPGVFISEEKYRYRQKLHRELREKYLQNEGVTDIKYIFGLDGDGDSCCVTTYAAYTNSTLINIYGQVRSIVHMTSVEPPMYQFVPHASCEPSSSQGCFGICVLEYVTLTFLIYDPVAKSMLFDQFLLPGYCSCKRVLYR